MPKKFKYHYQNDYDSADDLEDVTTLVSKNKKNKGENKKKSKKSKNSDTPRKRAHSAPPSRSGRTGHELWMSAVKNRQTLSLAGNRKLESPRHKTPTEYWVDTLRKTGVGISTESTGMNTFSGLKKPNDTAMAYLSTSSYLRQMAGTEKPRKYDNVTAKPPTGTPAYRSQEEYYEQVLELKKQIKSLNQEISTLRAKVRRTEEDNIKKEKEIGGLLDPTKNEEMRRTLGDKRPESGAVIQSLKQKILKLENQNREKENAYVKLQSDMKTTKTEEMRVQLEMCYQEIIRLQNSKDTGINNNTVRPGKENSAKMKALNQTIIRLNKQNEELQNENRALKEDLQREIEGTDKFSHRDYEDMNRNQLLGSIRELEKRLEKSKSIGETDSITSHDTKPTSRRKHVSGKIELTGSVEDRLDQLDKRETDLLEELEKQQKLVKRLKDEKTANRQKMEEAEKLIQDLQAEVDYLNERAGGGTSARRVTPRRTPASSRPPSGRRMSSESVGSDERRRRKKEEDEIENFRLNQAAKKVQRGWKSHKRADQEEKEAIAAKHREVVAARTIQREWRKHSNYVKDHDAKVEKFRQERAAKKIQREWTGYKYRKDQEEVAEATQLIQSTMRGHQSRKNRMRKHMSDFDDYDDDDDNDYRSYNDAADVISSSVKGHYNRKMKMKSRRYDSDEEETNHPARTVFASSTSSAKNRPGSAISRTSTGSRRSFGSQGSRGGGRKNYEEYDDDDDIQF